MKNKTIKAGVEDELELEDELDEDTEDEEEEEKVIKGKAKGKAKDSEETVEVSAGLLRELIESNKLLQSKVDKLDSNAVAQSPAMQVRRKTREFNYKVRLWDNKVVLGFDNVGTEKRPLFVYNIYNQADRKDEQFIDLILKDGDSKTVVKKIQYMNFLKDAHQVTCKFISKKEIEDIKEYGMIPKKEMAENGYGMFETMVLVPVEVVTKSYEMTLQLPEDEGGEQVVINSQWLNM